jgi:hypothetical protein
VKALKAARDEDAMGEQVEDTGLGFARRAVPTGLRLDENIELIDVGLDLFDDNPDDQENEGYQGNSGPTLEQLYKASALVIWPRTQSHLIHHECHVKVRPYFNRKVEAKDMEPILTGAGAQAGVPGLVDYLQRSWPKPVHVHAYTDDRFLLPPCDKFMTDSHYAYLIGCCTNAADLAVWLDHFVHVHRTPARPNAEWHNHCKWRQTLYPGGDSWEQFVGLPGNISLAYLNLRLVVCVGQIRVLCERMPCVSFSVVVCAVE